MLYRMRVEKFRRAHVKPDFRLDGHTMRAVLSTRRSALVLVSAGFAEGGSGRWRAPVHRLSVVRLPTLSGTARSRSRARCTTCRSGVVDFLGL
jgi:hypothetical protein